MPVKTEKYANWKNKIGKSAYPINTCIAEKLTRKDNSCSTDCSKCKDGTDKHFLYTQTTPANVWSVTHNLKKFPAVTIMSETGQQVFANIIHISKNNLTITFSIPFTGTASMN